MGDPQSCHFHGGPLLSAANSVSGFQSCFAIPRSNQSLLRHIQMLESVRALLSLEVALGAMGQLIQERSRFFLDCLLNHVRI